MAKQKRSSPSSKQRGQAVVEHIILWPVLVFVVMVIIQMSLLYRDKAQVNDAAFRAAREGALNHAFIGPMEDTFEEALAPLFMHSDGALGYIDAVNRSKGRPGALPSVEFRDKNYTAPKIDIVSPTREMFKAFSTSMYDLPDQCDEWGNRQIRRNQNDKSRCGSRYRGNDWREKQYKQIPNDNLDIRPNETKQVNVAGENIDVNLRDANLLKIRAHWCAPLEVPFGRFAVYHFTFTWQTIYTLTGGTQHPHWSVCRNATLQNRIRNQTLGTPRVMFIPMSASAIVRMQTPIRCEGDERRGRPNRCSNFSR